MSAAAQGYLHPAYAASLSEFGRPRRLPRSGGWLLERPIGNGPDHDAMGLYPLFACDDWSGLDEDLNALAGELVSVALVADPLTACSPEQLQRWFADVCVPFKTHYLVDLTQVRAAGCPTASAHHRREARRALAAVAVEVSSTPAPLLPDWLRLYAELTERRGLRGLRAFSARAFEQQLAVPGAVAVWARAGGEVVSASLWYVSSPAAYYHLAASSAAGYRLQAAYAVLWAAIEHFAAQGLAWLHLGGAPGSGGPEQDGLERFKRGWATTRRTAYFCGRVLDRPRYEQLCAGRQGRYFPLYRAGEFF